jgi:hypothetical protein
MIALILLRLVLAQIMITLDAPVTITLKGDAQPIDLIYWAGAGDQITIIARSLESEPIDVTLEILQENKRIAFNDDHQTTLPGLNAHDAAVENLIFPQASDYIIRVNSFNGAQSGHVEILVEAIPLAAPCEMPIQKGQLRRNGQFSCILSIDRDSGITITVRDIAGTLDPVLMVLDGNSSRTAYNDDHQSLNLELNTLDSQITDFMLSSGDLYTVQVTDFSGAAGAFELTFEVIP